MRLVRAYGWRGVESGIDTELAALQTGQPLRPIWLVLPTFALVRHHQHRLARRGTLAIEPITLDRLRKRLLDLVPPQGQPEDEEDLLPYAIEDHAQSYFEKQWASMPFGWGTLAAATFRDLIDGGLSPEIAESVVEATDEREPETEFLRSEGAARARATLELYASYMRLPVRPGFDSEKVVELIARVPEIGAVPPLVLGGFYELTQLQTDLIRQLDRIADVRVVLPRTQRQSRFADEYAERLALGAAAFDNVSMDEPTDRARGTLRTVLGAGPPEICVLAAAEAVRALDRGVAPEQIGILAAEALHGELRRQLLRGHVPAQASSPARARYEADAWLPLLGPEATGNDVAVFASWLCGHGADPALQQAAIDFQQRAIHPADGHAMEQLQRDGRYAALATMIDRAEPALRRARNWDEGSAAVGSWLRGLDEATDGRTRLAAMAAGIALRARRMQELGIAYTSARMRSIAASGVRGHGETIRLGDRGVAVGTPAQLRGRTFAHLIWCGLDAGMFPVSPSEDPLLPDRVRDGFGSTALRRRLGRLSGAWLAPKSAARAEQEMLYELYRTSTPVFTALISREDADGRKSSPSLPLYRELAEASGMFSAAIEKLVDEIVPRTMPESIFADIGGRPPPDGDAPGSLTPLRENMLRARRTSGLGLYDGQGLLPAATQVGITRLTRAAACRFRAAAELMNLPDEPAEATLLGRVGAIDDGTLAHGILQHWVGRSAAQAGIALAATPEELPRIVRHGAGFRLDPRLIDEARAASMTGWQMQVLRHNGVLTWYERFLADTFLERFSDRLGNLDGKAAQLLSARPAALELDVRVQAQGLELSGRIDRIDLRPRDGQEAVWVLTDYKPALKRKSGAPAFLWDAQLEIYGWIVSRMLGREAAVETRYVAYDAGRSGGFAASEPVDIPPLESAIASAVARIAGALSRRDAPPTPDEVWQQIAEVDPGACGYCTFARACRRYEPGYRDRAIAALRKEDFFEPLA